MDVDGLGDVSVRAPVFMAITASWTRLPASGPAMCQPRMRSVAASTTNFCAPSSGELGQANVIVVLDITHDVRPSGDCEPWWRRKPHTDDPKLPVHWKVKTKLDIKLANTLRAEKYGDIADSHGWPVIHGTRALRASRHTRVAGHRSGWHHGKSSRLRTTWAAGDTTGHR
jgi:hypothetical protein